MPYRLEITADNPVELANALTGLFSMTAVLQAQTQQRLAAAQAPKAEVVEEAKPEPKAETAEEAPKRGRGRPKKEEPKPVEEQLTESIEATAPEAEADGAEKAPMTRADISAKLVSYANLLRQQNPDNDEAARQAVFDLYKTLKIEPGLKNLPEDRYAEMAALIDERAPELVG